MAGTNSIEGQSLQPRPAQLMNYPSNLGRKLFLLRRSLTMQLWLTWILLCRPSWTHCDRPASAFYVLNTGPSHYAQLRIFLLDLFILCVMFGQHEGLCTTYIPGATGGWERAPDALEMELWISCEPQCGSWESNSSPLQELPVPLTT